MTKKKVIIILSVIIILFIIILVSIYIQKYNNEYIELGYTEVWQETSVADSEKYIIAKDGHFKYESTNDAGTVKGEGQLSKEALEKLEKYIENIETLESSEGSGFQGVAYIKIKNKCDLQVKKEQIDSLIKYLGGFAYIN